MSYSKKSFDLCSFNPMVEGRIRVVFPKLNDIVSPDWSDDPHLDCLIRYVIALYDPRSPVTRDEPDLNERKGMVATLFNLPLGDFRKTVFDHTHDYVAELTAGYLTRFAKNKEFASLVAIEYCFWESVRSLMKPITADNSKMELEAVQKKETIKDGIDKDVKRLDAYYKAFFGEDEALEKKIRKRGFTPEMMAITN